MSGEAPVVVSLLSSDDEDTPLTQICLPSQSVTHEKEEILLISESTRRPPAKRRRIFIDLDGSGSDEDVVITNSSLPSKPQSCQPVNTGAEVSTSTDLACVGENRGVRALVDYPHMRFQCLLHHFTVPPQPRMPTACNEIKPTGLNTSFCPNCYCYVCDRQASECLLWVEHSDAHDKSAKWRSARTAARKAAERAANGGRPKPRKNCFASLKLAPSASRAERIQARNQALARSQSLTRGRTQLKTQLHSRPELLRLEPAATTTRVPDDAASASVQ